MALLSRLSTRSALYSFCLGAVIVILTVSVTSQTYRNDVDALNSFFQQIGDPMDYLTGNWTGDDPCGSLWLGVYCNQTQRVHELRLLNLNLTGMLAPELGNLTSLNILDVMWNNISGSIPAELGNLKNLTLLLLNGNKFSGYLPESLGYLSNLVRLQVDENNLSGPIPKSFQYLRRTRHFHMNNNSFSESIPSELGQLPSLIHLLLDNNNLSGSLPEELSNISSLVTLQLDNNRFSGSLPPSYYTMARLAKLSLRNCNLSGIVQNLTSLTNLKYIDLSQNQLNGEFPSGELPINLNTIRLSFNQLNGGLPINIAELSNLQYLGLRHNNLSGVVPSNLGAGVIYNKSSSRLIIDLRENNFEGNEYTEYPSNVSLWLNNNPACNSSQLFKECGVSNVAADIKNISYQDPAVPLPVGCNSNTCDLSLNQELMYDLLKDLQTCFCASPILVGYRLKSPGFSYFPPFKDDLASYISSGLNVLQYQINISDIHFDGERLRMILKLFPSLPLHRFNDSEVDRLYNVLSTWVIPDSPVFGPAELLFVSFPFPYDQIIPTATKHSIGNGAFAGIVVGSVIFTAAAAAGAMFLLLRKRGYEFSKRKGKRDPRLEQIKASGVTDFKFEEMSIATKNFDKSMVVGRGGYGKVYKGLLPDGKVVAIKRAQEESLQGANEFYTEIEMLSRVHHRHLVSLVGYCDHEGEQMLVYEYIGNGTLRDALSAQRQLDFQKRVQIALGSARGILYLHTEADPPIFHRDIKASNILLDEKDHAKVADFGLSKLVPVADDEEGVAFGYVSTVVKGTPGYLDPEYFMTHKLTDRSDVYSFGVVLLELITGMQPISHGKNLVREVNMAYEAGMMTSFIDPHMGSYPSEALDLLVRLAICCCKDSTDARPSMADVVRGLEDIQRATSSPDSVSSDDVQDMRLHKHNTYSSKNTLNLPDSDGIDPLSGMVSEVSPR